MISDKQFNNNGFIPLHVGYRQLLSYQKSEIIYDGTVYFCKRFFQEYDRIVDQMDQAARSGKQNIVKKKGHSKAVPHIINFPTKKIFYSIN